MFRSTLTLAVCLSFVSGSPSSAAAETIEFTTQEGTWVSLDTSPAGGRLVFELLGDIYSLPIEGGAAEPLLTGSAFQSQPRFSPDGRQLAYVSDASGSDNVWIAAADGSMPRQVTELPRALVISPAWSHDGEAIFATVIADGPRAAEIWRYDATTGDGERVVANENGRAAPLMSSPAPGAYGPVPTPDGRALLYTSVTPRPYGSRDGAKSRILRFDFARGVSEPVAVAGDMPMKPGLSRDGKTLVYAAMSNGRTGLRTRDLDTGEERWLAYPIQRHQLEGRATRDVLPNFALTPDASTVFAAYGGKIRRLGLRRDSGAETVPFAARVALEVTPRLDFQRRVPQGPVEPRRVRHLAVAPDGRLAFVAAGRIYVAGVDGAQPRRLTSSTSPREAMPSWSPDGSWIVFVTWGPEGGHLWRAPADGSAPPTRLTGRSALWVDPVVAPGGETVVAITAPRESARSLGPGPPGRLLGDAALVEVPAAGGVARALAALPPGARNPHFARGEAGSELYLSSAQALLALELESGVVQPVLELPRAWAGGEVVADVRRGEALVLARRGRLGRVALPQGGTTAEPGDFVTLATRDVTGFAWGPEGPRFVQGRHLRGGAVADARVELALALPRATPEGTVVLRGATVLTMASPSAREVVADADVVVRGNRIVQVRARDEEATPEGAHVVDLRGKVIVPGFVDVHAHFFPSDERPEPEASWAFANLAFGVTTLRNPQAPADIFTLADMIDSEGLTGPRVFSTGPGLELGGWAGHYLAPPWQGFEAVRSAMQRYPEELGTHLLKSYLAGNRQERQWVVKAARELGMMVTTEGGADTKGNLTHAIDGFSGNEHAFPVAPIHDDVVQIVARSGITYAPTLVVSFGGALPVYRLLAEKRPHENPQVARWYPEGALYAASSNRVLWFPPEAYNDRDAAAGAAAILEAGGRVALGGHGEVQGLSAHWEMELLASGGMHPYDVLRAATIFGAETLGFAQDLGSVEPGKLADLVVLDRNPLDDIRNTQSVRMVMKNGVLYDAGTLDEVWPTPRPMQAPWWLESNSHALATRLDRHVRARIRSSQIPGVAVAVVRGGEVLLARGYGVANLENEEPVRVGTAFQSGSVGKMFTAAGIMALVEDGQIDLDASVRTYLDDAPAKWQDITVRHLLTHASGIPDYTGDGFDYRSSYSEERLVAMAGELELELPAGVRWNYSNTGYVMLGVLIHRVTGQPYWEFLRERIFDPAVMENIRVNDEPAVIRHRARGYVPTARGWEHASWVSPELNRTADGSMLVTLEDMLAWDRIVRERSVLRPESWDLMQSPMVLPSGNTHPYGFGWFLDEVGGRERRHHGGAWQGFTTQYSTYPGSAGSDLSVIVLANARSLATSALADELAALVDPRIVASPPPTTPISDPSPEQARYVSSMLAKAARGELELGDFEFVRQTIFPRIARAVSAVLQGLGAPDRMDLLAREPLGDDVALQYFAHYGARRFRVAAQLGPGGGLTGLRVREEPEQ